VINENSFPESFPGFGRVLAFFVYQCLRPDREGQLSMCVCQA